MIINHPGCEALNVLLKYFAIFLRSNDVKVMIPFVEESETHDAGGICAYLTRQLDQCDYFLLVFADPFLKGTLVNCVIKEYS